MLSVGLLRNELFSSLLGLTLTLIALYAYAATLVLDTLLRRSGEEPGVIGVQHPDAPGGTGRITVSVPQLISPLPGVSGQWRLDLTFHDRRIALRRHAGAGGRQVWVVSGARRGLYESGGLQLILGDLFGFAVRRLSYPGRLELVVPPAAQELNPGRPPSAGQLSERVGGPSQRRNELLIETRPYHPGDDLRRLNWKALARTDELLVRIGEQIPPRHRRITLLCDPGECPDEVAREAASILEELSRQGYSCRLTDCDTGAQASGESGPGVRRLLAALWTGEGRPLGAADLEHLESGFLISPRGRALKRSPEVSRAVARGALRLRDVACREDEEPEEPVFRRLLFVPRDERGTFGLL
ncbi:MAG: DUF58 domain-containing protein [Spirochaetaceae bacterium]